MNNTGKLNKQQQELARQNVKLVSFVINKINSNESKEELYGAGYIGLCKAAASWSEVKDCKFSTFASHLIKHEILNLLKTRNIKCRSLDEESKQSVEDVGYKKIEDRQLLELIFSEMHKVLNEDEEKVIRLSIGGFILADISSEMRIDINEIYKLKKSVAEKLRAFTNYDE